MGAGRVDMSTPESRIFSSWKEIAAFLGKGVRTVQRWEATLGLPIQRPNGYGSNVVVASESDLREWLRKGGERSASRRHNSDPAENQKLSERLEALEQTHRRLESLISKLESRFEQIEHAFGVDSMPRAEFNDGDHHRRRRDGTDGKNGKGRSRYGTSSVNKRDDGKGNSSSGMA